MDKRPDALPPRLFQFSSFLVKDCALIELLTTFYRDLVVVPRTVEARFAVNILDITKPKRPPSCAREFKCRYL